MSPEDADLMLKAGQGDSAAFSELVDKYRDRTVNMLFRMVGNRDDAEELAQDAFLNAWRAAGRYRHEAAFSTWFYRIVTNLAINHRHKKSPDRLPNFEPASDVASAADVVAQTESENRIWQALHELPVRQRAALVLCRVEGCSYQEAALAMDVSVESIRALIARGRDALRERLRPILSSRVAKE